jgi:hypothetical protein
MFEDVKTDKDLHDWAVRLADDGAELRRAWEGVWWENIATFAGDLWVEWDPHRRRLTEPIKKPRHKVRLPINLAQPVTRTERAKILKNRPQVDVLARSGEKHDLDSAEVGDKVLNNYIEREFYMPRVRRRTVDWALLTGLGGIFVDWDEKAAGGVEFLVDPEGNPVVDPRVIKAFKEYYRKQKKAPKTKTFPLGDLRMVPLSPFQLIYDFSTVFFEEAWWCIVTEVMDVDQVYRRWETEVDDDPNARPGTIESRFLEKYDLTGQLQIKPSKVQKLTKVHRLFVKPGHPYFPGGAHLVYTKDKLIKKEGFPFLHGELPVSVMGHIPFPVAQYAMSVLQQLRGPVLELSKTESQLMDNRNLMGNPPWRVAKQSKLEKEIQNRPGMRIVYTHVPNVPPPEPIPMPEVPGYIQNLIPMLKEHILEIAGQGETSQGRVPPGARSGVAIAYLQEEDDTRIGPTIQEFEEMIERVAWQQLQIVAEKYDVPRTVRIFKRHGDVEVFDFQGDMLAGIGGVVCQAGSALPRSKAAKQQFILDLWDRKLEQDPRRVLEYLEMGEGQPMDFEIDMDQAERENRKMLQGEEVDVQGWYNHEAHHYIHRQFMKSADFEELPENIKEIFRQHDELHDQWQQYSQQMQQFNAAPPGQNGAGPGPLPPGTPAPPGAEQPPPGQEAPGQAANGMNVPSGPSGPFTATQTPRSLVDNGPQ